MCSLREGRAVLKNVFFKEGRSVIKNVFLREGRAVLKNGFASRKKVSIEGCVPLEKEGQY